ncbi:hypothetical protein SAMD00019534_001550 [Acytostelium subglobosum LB1]|uniref:hypothetical protein n=1 Tax=Acytostelium subglobosum LB1 TaxID=1410327 RepID=UPI00064493DC|nr:hypothetical protein SAMD00019534_001550 [Acytostelium subglobosum LB1]GAM16980.1 hypothetical protein SAMD00019534_001550 [Acytostelium subglobosum LB1]|eukprot:XP_012759042.1 hypothetical protein SAMD00019534_001550 [Acytostelium subglobosum LB1]
MLDIYLTVDDTDLVYNTTVLHGFPTPKKEPTRATILDSTYQLVVLEQVQIPLGSSQAQSHTLYTNKTQITWKLQFVCQQLPSLNITKLTPTLTRTRVLPMPQSYLKQVNNQEALVDAFRGYLVLNESLEEMYNSFECFAYNKLSCQVDYYRPLPNNQSMLLLRVAPDEFYNGTVDIVIRDYANDRNITLSYPPLFTKGTANTTNGDIKVYPYYVLNQNKAFKYGHLAAVINSSSEGDFFSVPSFNNDVYLGPLDNVRPVLGSPTTDTQTLVLSSITNDAGIILYQATKDTLINVMDILSDFTNSYSEIIKVDRFPVLDAARDWDPIRITTIFKEYPSRYSFVGANPEWQWMSPSLFWEYPFGLNGYNASAFVEISASFLFSKNGKTTSNSHYFLSSQTEIKEFQIQPSSMMNDTTPPSLTQSIIVEHFHGNKYLVTASIYEDASGFRQMVIHFDNGQSVRIDQSDQASGFNDLDGVYQKIITIDEVLYPISQSPVYSILLIDNAEQSLYIHSKGHDFDTVPLGHIRANVDYNVDDITMFYFETYVMNVSSSRMSNKLYFNTTRNNLDWRVGLVYGHPEENPDYLAYGYFDYLIQMFVVEFNVPARTYTKQLQYFVFFGLDDFETIKPLHWDNSFVPTGMKSLDCALLQLKFPMTSYVNITSTYGDEMPPLITDVKVVGPNPVVLTSLDQVIKVGWEITIEDQPNGFHSGTINVISNMDGLIRKYDIVANPTSNKYLIQFNVTGQFRNQTFSFGDVILRDNTNPITEPPKITNLKYSREYVDVGSLARDIEVLFEVLEPNGLSNDHDWPVVYITSSFEEIFPLSTTLISHDSGTGRYFFKATGVLPYGFGASAAMALISIYGLFGQSQLTVGYTAEELLSLNLRSRFYIVFNHTVPIIESYESTPTTVTVYGYNFGVGSLNTSGVIIGGHGNGSAGVVMNKTKHSSVMMVFDIAPMPNPTNLVIQVINGPYISNNITIPYLPSPPPTPTITCPGSPPCSGFGSCSPTKGCVCQSGHYSEDCSQSVVATIPELDDDKPTSNYVFEDIKADVNVLKLREMDQNGVQVDVFDLANWTLTNEFDKTHVYQHQAGNTSSMIQVTLKWYNSTEMIQFAGDNMSIDASTLKYTIDIDHYPFKSRLNTLQVVMGASISTSKIDGCSSKDLGYVNGNSSIYWMRLRVNKIIVYAHFLQVAMVDRRVYTISNVLLDDSLQTVDGHNSSTMIGINVPYFERSVTLDPNFNVLIDEGDDDTSTKTCSPHGSKGLSNIAIAGIVIGVVAMVAAVLAAALIWRRREKNKKMELDKMHRKMKDLTLHHN